MSDVQAASEVEVTAPGEVRVRRALITVSDKTGIADFARCLRQLGVEIVSTGGTARHLAEAGIETRAIDDVTGFPEMLDGRVKTINPKIAAGVLAVRDNPEHVATLNEHGIEPIDLVCVNLYPFEQTAARRGVEEHEVIENIDIGGPSLIRAAAKNLAFTAVVTSPESYDAVADELRETDGKLSMRTREALALEAFTTTARYDASISEWFGKREDDFPGTIVRAYEKVLDLSYGENPHQRAAYYANAGARTHLLSMVGKLHGKELSFNNLLDLDSARRLLEEFEVPGAVIVKHNNPCGCAVGTDLEEAFEKAFATDPMSAFGGIVCLNREVDAGLATKLNSMFLELVYAPDYTDEALEILKSKKNIRLLIDEERRVTAAVEVDMKRVRGGLLVQDRDADLELRDEMQVVTDAKPTEEQWGELLFAWKVCKHVRSNAIVLGKSLGTVGIGAGQMSRVDSVRIAIEKARAAELDLSGSVMASDAFFPFPDGPEFGIGAGVKAIIQPGGSKNDQATIDACNAAGVAMVFTSRRHFRH
ncbi:MAG TPA: bifunctional phosphoribosylaminoimidazolecarboxamide formyltransferase/IMP cyclohydrolase [Thermoleophilaceae bacterium]|nr:bifunctional phosphoribosylaminoimidazolecarboxamide formyltransferase/IMP cyclohydrolase [Thermoleophilaceae bacterium]